MFKKHIVDVLGYIGIGFISGSISHGFFSGFKSAIMALIGVILFVIHQYFQEKKTESYLQIIVFGLVYSISIGMLSGGLQHFLDSPTRSLWIIPTGYFLSYLIFTIHMKAKNFNKNIGIALLGAVILGILAWSAFMILPKSIYSNIDDGHGKKNNISCHKGEEGCLDTNDTRGMMGSISSHNITSEEQFLLNMIPHHQEAVDTSNEIVARGVNGDEKILAQNIIDAQTKEIVMMQGWLKERYPNNTGTTTYQKMMPNLVILSGKSLDISYLQGMMMHHMGAIGMAESLLKITSRHELIDFANAIIKAQSEEIQIMKNLMMSEMPRGGMMGR